MLFNFKKYRTECSRHKYVYIHKYVYKSVCTYVCTYIRACVQAYVRRYVRMYVCIYVRTYVRTYVPYVCVYVRVCVQICVCVCCINESKCLNRSLIGKSSAALTFLMVDWRLVGGQRAVDGCSVGGRRSTAGTFKSQIPTNRVPRYVCMYVCLHVACEALTCWWLK